MTRRERRQEWRELAHWLAGDLYERDRDYSGHSMANRIVPVEVDHDRGAIWGSPLGWRVMATVEDAMVEPQRITLTIYDFRGEVYREPFTYDRPGDGVAWLEATLP